MLIVTLIALGLMLISFEVFVPGMVLGIFGGGSLLTACYLTYKDYGFGESVYLFIGCIVLVILTIILELKLLPKTKMGMKLFLNQRVDDKSTDVLGESSLVGKTGIALTAMAPTGVVMVDNIQYEGFSQDGFIEKGESIIIIDRDNFRILVRKHLN